MTLRTWIRLNRPWIDEEVHRQVPTLRLNDAERELWVLNDEGLYCAARAAGVDEDGTSGQDRESYTDTQDRDCYTVEEEP